MKKRIYLCSFLLVLVGVLFFLINAKGLIELQGLFPLSILLMVTPTMYWVFDDNHSINKTQSLLLILGPLLVLNYIYYIQMGVPVGFQDPHDHILQYLKLFSDSGNILFENAQRISFNFVGLYLFFRSISLINNLDIVLLASAIPPFLNIIIIVMVYLIVNRLHDNRIALFSTMVYGWSYEVVVYGQEFRTQTIGVLLLFTITFIIINSLNNKRTPSIVITLIILLMAIVTSSFVVICNTLLLFAVTLIIIVLFNKFNNEQIISSFSFGVFIIFIIFFFVYLLYIGTAIDNIILSIQNLFLDTFTRMESPTLQTGNVIYGSFSKIMIRIFWLVFIFSYAYYFISIIKEKDMKKTVFFLGYSSLLAFFVLNNLVGPLSAGRVYVIAFLLISTVTTYGLYRFTNNKLPIKKIAVISFAICIIMANAVKLPNYISGDKIHIRSVSQIDFYTYWHIDYGQYLASDFLLLAPSSKTIYTYSYINRNPLLINSHKNKLVLKGCIGTEVNNLNCENEEYIFLENKFNNGTFMGRKYLPYLGDLNNLCNIYSNNDYLIYQTCSKK
jgi:hypothetical protein